MINLLKQACKLHFILGFSDFVSSSAPGTGGCAKIHSICPNKRQMFVTMFVLVEQICLSDYNVGSPFLKITF